MWAWKKAPPHPFFFPKKRLQEIDQKKKSQEYNIRPRTMWIFQPSSHCPQPFWIWNKVIKSWLRHYQIRPGAENDNVAVAALALPNERKTRFFSDSCEGIILGWWPSWLSLTFSTAVNLVETVIKECKIDTIEQNNRKISSSSGE